MSEQTISKQEQRKLNRLRRDETIRNEFQKLYNEDRIRFDDCVKKLAEMYFLSEATISVILFKKSK